MCVGNKRIASMNEIEVVELCHALAADVVVVVVVAAAAAAAAAATTTTTTTSAIVLSWSN